MLALSLLRYQARNLPKFNKAVVIKYLHKTSVAKPIKKLWIFLQGTSTSLISSEPVLLLNNHIQEMCMKPPPECAKQFSRIPGDNKKAKTCLPFRSQHITAQCAKLLWPRDVFSWCPLPLINLQEDIKSGDKGIQGHLCLALVFYVPPNHAPHFSWEQHTWRELALGTFFPSNFRCLESDFV